MNIMTERNIEIFGLCETRWQGNNDFNSDEFRVIASGNEIQGHRSVAIILRKKWANIIVNILHVSDRLLLVKINTQTRSLILLQVYFSTSSSTEEELENMYEQIKEAPKSGNSVIIMGNFNTIIGEG